MSGEILTDENGRPFERPVLANFSHLRDYFDAVHTYRVAVAECANRAFDAQFRKSLRAK